MSAWYPPGADRVNYHLEAWSCSTCGREWNVVFTTELGETTCEDEADTERCPRCGSFDIGVHREGRSDPPVSMSGELGDENLSGQTLLCEDEDRAPF